MHFHLATLNDLPIWARMRDALYSDLKPDYILAEIRRIVDDSALTTFLIFPHGPQSGRDIPKGEPIGMIELSLRNIVDGCISSPVAYIDGLYLVEPWQGKGLGKEMMDFIRKWAQEQGCTELAVDTEPENQRAQKFYLREGFEETFRIVQFRMAL